LVGWLGNQPQLGCSTGWLVATLMRTRARFDIFGLAKAGSIGSSSSPTAKQARVFASTSEVERKRKAEQSLADQVTALRQLVTQLVEG
jgi:hypothetical protein